MIPGFKHDVTSINYIADIPEAYEMMERKGIDVLWVMPQSPFSEAIRYEYLEDIPSSFSWYSPPKNIYDGQPYILRLRRKGYGYTDKFICFPAHMECCIPRAKDKGQWSLPNYDTLHATIDYIENGMNIPYLYTNGNVGEQYLRKCHEDIKTHIRPLPKEQVEPFQEVLHGAMDRPVWRKRLPVSMVRGGIHGLSIDDVMKEYIVGFDKNGQYVGASNAVYLGNGGFTYAPEFRKDFVGFWHYRIQDVGNTPFNGYDLPCPLDVNRGWASTALINAAIDVGINIIIEGGIIWEEQGRYLQKWASNLWQSRVNLRDSTKYPNEAARENAERTMKAIPNSMVGRFMNEYSKEYHHPDWQLGIVHQAMASQVYTLRGLLNNHGLKPVLVNKDAFYILTDDPQHLPEIDKYSQELRGFKKIGISPLSDTIIEAFSEEKSTNKLESLIKREMKEYEQSKV